MHDAPRSCPKRSRDFSEEDLIRQEPVLISVTQGSYIKRTPLAAYRAQRRGGRGVQGMRTKEEDEVVDLFSAHTLDHVLFFTNRGRVYGQRVFALPEAARDGRGLPMVNYLNLAAEERVTTLLVVPDFEEAEYVTLLTRHGRIKRMKLSEFSDVRPSGIIAMNLEPGDELGWARATFGKQDFIIVTTGGKALRFTEDAVRAMGRTAAGVLAMDLREEDSVATFDVVEPGGDLLIITQNGYGKRTPLAEYPATAATPGGRGRWITAGLDETGRIVRPRVVQADDQITIITSNGIVLRTPVAAISQMSRMTRGVRIVNPDDGDTVAAMARLSAALEAEAAKHAEVERAKSRAANGQPATERSCADQQAGEPWKRSQSLEVREPSMSLSYLSASRRRLATGGHARASAGRLAETLVAFANGDGGTVLLGVDRRDSITGELHSRMRRACCARRSASAGRWCALSGSNSRIARGWRSQSSVPRSTRLHSLADGRVLVRTHAGNEPLDGAKISHLAATKASGDYEMEPVPGATRNDLDHDVIQDYLHAPHFPAGP